MTLLLCVGAAWADAEGEGQGYSLREPAGFETFSADDLEICPVHRVDLTAKVAVPSAETRRVYGVGSILEPDALLLVARIKLDAGALASSRSRHRYMLERLFLSKPHFDALVAAGKVELRPVQVGGHDALHLSHAGSEGPLGLEEPATRALLVVGDDFLVLVMLQIRDPDSMSVDDTWRVVRAGFSMDASTRPVHQALLYGGIALAGLLLLVLLARLVARGRRVSSASHTALASVSMSSEGWGGSRPTAVGAPPAETPPVPATTPPEPEPGEPREAPTPVAAERAVAEPPIDSSPPLPSTPAGPPPRKGLQSTRPANGRFTQ